MADLERELSSCDFRVQLSFLDDVPVRGSRDTPDLGHERCISRLLQERGTEIEVLSLGFGKPEH